MLIFESAICFFFLFAARTHIQKNSIAMRIENVHFSQEFVFLPLYQRRYDIYQSRFRGTVGKKVLEDFQRGLRHIEFKSVFPFFDVQENSVVITAGIERKLFISLVPFSIFRLNMQDKTICYIQLLFTSIDCLKKNSTNTELYSKTPHKRKSGLRSSRLKFGKKNITYIRIKFN